MKVLVTGASGLIGSALVPQLAKTGHSVTRLVRAAPPPGIAAVPWDPAAGRIDPAKLEEFDAVVHLAGENIAGRWTPEKKARIRDSRVEGTRLLAEALARLVHPPKTLLCASAIGYYGDRGDELLTEASAAGKGFLADTCREWEAAAQPAAQKGIRVVHLRIGVVLSPRGGALKQMLLPFQLGLGGVVGSGRQYFSWIAIDDLVGVFLHALTNESLRGAVNAVAPEPVTNRVVTKTLGAVLARPTIFPMPAFAARLAFGEMADELLLASARVEPARLRAAGFAFRFPQLEAALRHLLNR
jgi:hypothetical protein